MRKTISPTIPTQPIVEQTGRPTQQFRTFMLQVEQRGLIIGTGSPEGVVEAEQGQEYMDDAGTAGSIKYIKRDADISGDKSQGWILV